MFIFGLQKLEHLLSRKNPQLTTNNDEGDPEDAFSTENDKFMLAFSLNSIMGETIHLDEKYVRFVAATW